MLLVVKSQLAICFFMQCDLQLVIPLIFQVRFFVLDEAVCLTVKMVIMSLKRFVQRRFMYSKNTVNFLVTLRANLLRQRSSLRQKICPRAADTGEKKTSGTHGIKEMATVCFSFG